MRLERRLPWAPLPGPYRMNSRSLRREEATETRVLEQPHLELLNSNSKQQWRVLLDFLQ